MMWPDMRVWAAAEEGKPGASQPDLPADAGSHTIERLDQLRNSKGGLGVAQIRSQLQKTMQADAAVFRTQVMAAVCSSLCTSSHASLHSQKELSYAGVNQYDS